jgi:hypothetical protein
MVLPGVDLGMPEFAFRLFLGCYFSGAGMAQERITKRVVDRLKATGKEQFVWDAELKGFGVRVQASGA